MGRTTQRRAELEMGLLKLCSPPKREPAELAKPLAARLEKLESAVKHGIPAHAPAGEKRESSPAPTREEIRKTPVEIFDRWDEVLVILKEKNTALYGTLHNSTAYVGGELFLVDAGGGMFSEMVRSDGYAKESLRGAVTQVTGKKYRLGPYNPERHEVKDNGEKLDAIMGKAKELGVDTKTKE
jgi:DNA polymerase-3 subunit gamma/tau